MPIFLDETQAAKTPPVDIPGMDWPLAWVTKILIDWDHGTPGSAAVEMFPMSADGNAILRRNPDGTDAVIHGKIPNMLAAMDRCPELAAAMTPLIKAIHAWNKIAVEDAKKLAEEVAAREAIEAARIAAIEADRIAAEAARIAAEEARLAQIEIDRLAEIEAARIAAEEEAARIAAYNTPEAKAARVAAAKADADARAAEAQAALLAADALLTPEVVDAITKQQAISDVRAAQQQAAELAAIAAAAAAEVVRLEGE